MRHISSTSSIAPHRHAKTATPGGGGRIFTPQRLTRDALGFLTRQRTHLDNLGVFVIQDARRAVTHQPLPHLPIRVAHVRDLGGGHTMRATQDAGVGEGGVHTAPSPASRPPGT